MYLNFYDSYLMKFPNPVTGEEAKFSYPHILGRAIVKGRVWLDTFADETVVNHKYKEARKKIDAIVHPEWPPRRVDALTPVTIKLKNGGVFSKEIQTSRQPDRDQLLNTYREATDGVLMRNQTEKFNDLLLRMDKLKDVSKVMDLLILEKGFQQKK